MGVRCTGSRILAVFLRDCRAVLSLWPFLKNDPPALFAVSYSLASTSPLTACVRASTSSGSGRTHYQRAKHLTQVRAVCDGRVFTEKSLPEFAELRLH